MSGPCRFSSRIEFATFRSAVAIIDIRYSDQLDSGVRILGSKVSGRGSSSGRLIKEDLGLAELILIMTVTLPTELSFLLRTKMSRCDDLKSRR